MHFYQVYDGWTASAKVLYDQKKMQNNTKEMRDTIYSLSNKMLVRFERPIAKSRTSFSLYSRGTVENKSVSWDVNSV